ncbi:MAG: protein subunit release factor B [Lysobacterales bacterium]|jgi:protein subunit release factor B
MEEPELRKKMRTLKVFFKDIKEQFVRASGPGGQNVNKTSTCVMLHHLPTGIQVKCQAARSQALNRDKALELLVKKIEKQRNDIYLKKQQEIAKKKRQNRKRSRSQKEKMLDKKSHQSTMKQSRKKIDVRKGDI